MLYDRWQEVARANSKELALRDLASGNQWTFAELRREAETGFKKPPAIVYPQGHSADFILTLLRAWRCQAVSCPLEAHQQPLLLPPPPSPCCHLKSTSATTGVARAVAFTGEQLAADAANIVASMGLRPDWPNLGVISLAHSYGFSNLVLPLLLHGIPLILTPSPLPESVRRAIRAHPDLTLPGVPALWRAWHEAGVLRPTVRLAISAGAPLPLELEQAVFNTCGVKIHNFYGSSECGGIAYDPTPVPRTDPACAGRPLHGVKVSLSQTGAMRVRGPAVGETYWPLPSETLARGRFQTGDLAEINDGLVYLRGRVGDLINIAGRKVSPTTIEDALRQHPAVAECLVFGVPAADAHRTDHIVACVALKTHSSPEALKRFLLHRLPAWQLPREWWFRALEVNARGKLSRADWRNRFLEARARGELLAARQLPPHPAANSTHER
jgi:long-chain acyl-CoA synthetase